MKCGFPDPAWMLPVVLAAISACSGEEPAQPRATEPPVTLVAYGAGIDGSGLEGRIGAFSEATGIDVELYLTDGRRLVDAVIAHDGDPPADVLLTDGVFGAFLAGSEGGLRPLTAVIPQSSLPDALRDPDGTWVAAALNLTVIAYDARRVSADALGGWDSLGADRFSGQVCLSSSKLPGNRTLIATLIRELGARPAEILVRSWLRNLAEPVFADPARLLAALAAGDCAVAIVTLEAGRELPGHWSENVGLSVPEPPVGDIVAAGVTRHTSQPEAANRFVAFLAETSGIDDSEVPLPDVAVGGWLGEDAMALAERAGYP